LIDSPIDPSRPFDCKIRKYFDVSKTTSFYGSTASPERERANPVEAKLLLSVTLFLCAAVPMAGISN
jgi:hypothetical protein